jgi:hypothetical protein
MANAGSQSTIDIDAAMRVEKRDIVEALIANWLSWDGLAYQGRSQLAILRTLSAGQELADDLVRRFHLDPEVASTVAADLGDFVSEEQRRVVMGKGFPGGTRTPEFSMTHQWGPSCTHCGALTYQSTTGAGFYCETCGAEVAA